MLTISINIIYWLLFITDEECILSEVETVFLYTILSSVDKLYKYTSIYHHSFSYYILYH